MPIRKYIVYDRNVERYARDLEPDAPALGIVADEAHKTIDTVLGICRWLMDQGADRDALVLAVGGGCTSDMVGFAASIYKRGVRYAVYPTTLLSMVDASIGGKTGVNLDGYKNMLGVIRYPYRVEIHPEYLQSLPPHEFRSGAAEMLKTFLIDNKGGFYEKAVKVLSKPLDTEALLPLIFAAGDVKRRIVNKDPYEDSLRRVLNLGHTYAHAIEWWQAQEPGRTDYSHGEAVAIGVICAARLSESRGACARGLADKLASDFESCGLPTGLPCAAEDLIPAIAKDKKVDGDNINFVLINKIGKVSVCEIPVSEI